MRTSTLLGILASWAAIATQSPPAEARLSSSASESFLSTRYDLVNPSSIHPDLTPQYTAKHSTQLPHRLKSPRINRRSNSNTTTTTITNITSSFQLQFTCRNSASCSYAQTTFIHATQRLSQILSLPAQVIISATFESFCIANAADCGSSTLGLAAPASFHTWSAVAGNALGVDTAYSYPSALAKQLAPNDTAWGPNGTVGSSVVDIFARFNADFPWWFTTQSSSPPAATNHAPYDFEQIVLHELYHGLGFISSWYPWTGPGLLLPSYPVTDPNTGNYVGLGAPYIFNKWMVDDVASTWYYTYSDQILAAASTVNAPDYASWVDGFKNTSGFQIAASLFNNVTTTNGRTLLMYPLSQGGPADSDTSPYYSDYGFVMLYTPSNFSTGSSISHVDATFYDGSSEFLMRPFATSYTALDDYVPMAETGPIGEITIAVLRALGYKTILDVI
ncbi:hypothetical protein SmJEL517_g03997 [Synchytrium microbalum]|uniref:Uncharacterized protein n=1 Tax=Synchytrium microbalum TaxID=1806994 RepID=A0A507C4C2_9FUNG|nr:uncharacterized protein SmJEL517_g03997 [Synchytrium microbalum]TPX32964.1 hypothetical protein SmJEL517_g03997 [Synchytrium microbalum]